MQKITKWIFLLSTFLLTSSAFAAIDLELSMTADQTNVDIYKNFTYTMILSNNGNETATGIEVDFGLPPNTAYTNSSASKGTYILWTRTWSIAELQVGESATLEVIIFTLVKDKSFKGFAQVIAVDQIDADSTPNNNAINFPVEDDEAGATVLAIGQGQRDYALTVSTNESEFSVGDDVIYTLSMTNNSTEVMGPIMVKAYLSDDLEVNRHGGSGIFDLNTFTWTIDGNMNPNQTLEYDIIGKVLNIDQPISAFFEVIASTHQDTNSTPNNDNGALTADEDDEAATTVHPYQGAPLSDLELQMDLTTTNPDVGEQFKMTLTATNHGPANNSMVHVRVVVPSGLGNITYFSSSNTGYNVAGDWFINFIADGESKIFELSATILDDTNPKIFFAEVSETSIPDPDSTPNNNATLVPVEDDEAAIEIGSSGGLRPNARPKNARYIGQGNKEPLFLTCELENNGDAELPNGIYSAYISTDEILSDDDKRIASTLMPGLSVGQSTRFVTLVQTPNVPYGEYYLIWVMDVNETIEETNEFDNQIAIPINVVEPSTDDDYFLQYFGTGTALQLEETTDRYELITQFSDSENSYTHGIMTKEGVLLGNPFPKTIAADLNTHSFKRVNTGFVGFGNSDEQTLLITRRTEQGGPEWTKEFSNGLELQAADISQTADGGFIATGSAFAYNPIVHEGENIEIKQSYVFTWKVDANGTEEWFKYYDNLQPPSLIPYFDSGRKVIQLEDGTYIVLANRAVPVPGGPPNSSFSGSDVRVYRIDSNGEIIGEVEPGNGQLGAYSSISSLITTQDGGYAYTHLLNYAPGNSGQIAFANKEGGTKSWEYARSTSKFGTAYFNDIVEMNDGNYMLVGNYGDLAAPENPAANFFKLDENGTELWTNHIDKIANVMIQTNDGGFLIAGSKNGEAFAAKLDSETNLTPPIETDGVDIELQYTADREIYRQWERVNYTLTATNIGTETATNLVISDPIPFGMAFTSKTVSTGTYNLWTQTWTIPELEAGETATLDLALFTLLNDAQIVKFAQVKSLDQTDIDSTPNNNSTTVPNEDDETAVSITPINFGGGSGKDVLENPIAQAGTLKLYNLFPVPADDHINLVFGTNGFQVNVLLYDVNGRLLKRKSLKVNRGENALQLEVGDLASGFYTISLETPEGFVRGKFLKQ
ncbi:MAG: CARDB domain-containing protein [Chitinophagales bacterium]